MSLAEITLSFYNTHSFKDMEEIRNFCPDVLSVATIEVTYHQEVEPCSSTDKQANIYEYFI